MLGKRGQELSTSTIILIILAVVVLVVLVLGFTIGWQKIIPFVSTTNVDTIQTACSTACSTGSTYDFCTVPREINDGTNPQFKQSCFNLSTMTQYSTYGIAKCVSITCPTPTA